MATGTVLELHRWPVKSFAGERLAAVTLGEHGVHGDRAYAVTVADGPSSVGLSARRAPRLLRWSAAYEGDPATAAPVVTAPEGSRHEWGEPGLRSEIEESVGRPVALAEAAGRHHDRPGTVLVTTEATRRQVEATLGLPLDVRRFRPNLHLQLDAPAYAEEGWGGWRLQLATGALLELLQPCERCIVTTHEPARPGERRPEVLRELQLHRRGLFGVLAAVRRPGRVVEGEGVEVRPP